MKKQFDTDNKLPEQSGKIQNILQQDRIQHSQVDRFWAMISFINHKAALPFSLLVCVIGFITLMNTLIGAWTLDGECSFLYYLGLISSILNPLFTAFFLFISRISNKGGRYSMAKVADFILLTFLLVPVYAIVRWEYLDYKFICGFY